ncbi:hypothetical protein HK414_19740 [Ramlibacter terrae]|uniref:TIGR02588 family protein n=1 Tax=Ramlibacter terrae TaxID=2732511 RepID=A0ABX6P788_9BURK|nr:hypothetical protein HK414_19740 [Ramlibacter terrae]
MARPPPDSDSDSGSGDHERQPAPGDEGPPPFWQWAVAAPGLVLVLACLGYLVVQALAGTPTPPDPVVEVVSVRQQGARYRVAIRVHNRGKATAEALKIVGELKQGATAVERSETEFQFLPGESSREGGLFFSRDPRPLQLDLRPESFQAP